MAIYPICDNVDGLNKDALNKAARKDRGNAMNVRFQKLDNLATELGEESFALGEVWIELHAHGVATQHAA